MSHTDTSLCLIKFTEKISYPFLLLQYMYLFGKYNNRFRLVLWNTKYKIMLVWLLLKRNKCIRHLGFLCRWSKLTMTGRAVSLQNTDTPFGHNYFNNPNYLIAIRQPLEFQDGLFNYLNPQVFQLWYSLPEKTIQQCSSELIPCLRKCKKASVAREMWHMAKSQ